MIAKKSQSKKRITIYIVVVVIMIAANIYIYFYNSSNDNIQFDTSFEHLNSESADTVTTVGNHISGGANKKEIPDSPLEHYLYSELEKVGDWPVIPNNVGKANPFAPFFYN